MTRTYLTVDVNFLGQRSVQSTRDAGSFEESKHKRGVGGKFAAAANAHGKARNAHKAAAEAYKRGDAAGGAKHAAEAAEHRKAAGGSSASYAAEAADKHAAAGDHEKAAQAHKHAAEAHDYEQAVAYKKANKARVKAGPHGKDGRGKEALKGLAKQVAGNVEQLTQSRGV